MSDLDPNFSDSSQSKPSASGLQPRFGAFITLTIALLLLFGAASRLGKTNDPVILFGLDEQAERLSQQEAERLRASQLIGSKTVNYVPNINQAIEIDSDFIPPVRTPSPVATPTREQPRPSRENLARTATNANNSSTSADSNNNARTYTVRAGDTWFKIAQNVLGDGARWQEIQRLNPETKNSGLLVGSTLRLP